MAGAAGFFRLLLPIPDQIAAVHRQFAEVRDMLAALALPIKGRLIARVEDAYVEFTQSLNLLAAQIASEAEDAVRAKYDKTRVRPDTGAQPHLRDLLTAVPVAARLATGAVGIGDVAELDRVPYWKAQEFGLSAGFVGRTLAGYFFAAGGGAGVPADPSLSRVHPLFRATSPGLAPHMTIANAIEPGHFLTDASREMAAAWLKRYQTIENHAIAKLNQVGAVIQAEMDAIAVEAAARVRRSRL